MKLRELMRRAPFTTTDTTTLGAAHRQMRRAQIRHLPVLGDEVQQAMVPSVPATAADAMTPFPFAVRPDSLLVEAVGIMIDHHIRHLPVVSTASAVVGMLSDRDVRTAIGDPSTFVQLHRHDQEGLHVVHFMRKAPAVIAFDTPLPEVAKHFAEEHVGAVPVVDKFGALLGIVSYLDVLRVLAG